MRQGTADRGVAPVVGAILIFAILVVAFSAYQGVVVPDQNRNVEITHNQQVQGDLLDLRNAILRAGSVGTDQSTTVEMVAGYPDRLIAVNPPPMSAELRTVRPRDGDDEPVSSVVIRDAVATDPDVADYWNGTDRTFETTTIEYTPSYAEYLDAPTTRYEHSYLLNEFAGDEQLLRSRQSLVADDVITVVTLAGDYDRTASQSIGVETRPRSVSTNTIRVEPAPGSETIDIELPTHVSAANEGRLREQFADEPVVDGVSVDEAAGTLTVSLTDPDDGLTLRLAKVGIGPGVERPPPAYLAPTTSEPVLEDQPMEFEVRDGYNNPVAGVLVSVPGCGTDRSGDAGTVSFECSAGDYEATIVDVDDTPRSFTVISPEAAIEDGYAIEWDTDRIEALHEETDGIQSSQCTDDECSVTVDTSVTDAIPLVAATEPPVVGGIISFETPTQGLGMQPSIAETVRDDGDGIGHTNLTGITEDVTTTVTAAWGTATDELALDITAIEAPPAFSWIEAEPDGPGGNINNVESTFVMTGDLDNVTVTVTLYDGDSTDDEQLAQDTVSGIQPGIEQDVSLSFSPPSGPPITIEFVAERDGETLDRCVGTFDNNEDPISTDETTIECE